jgi:hypothetical protein
MRSILTAAMLCLGGAVAGAEEGGKLPWKRPDDKKFDEMFQQLKRNGKAFVLYFTSKG